jgi:hypothetical protein
VQRQQQQQQQQHEAVPEHALGELGTSSFEFEFVNIEFLKPTRMNKVRHELE